MTKEDVIGWLEFLSEQEHVKADGIAPCDTEIALGMAIEALKQPEIIWCKNCKNCVVRKVMKTNRQGSPLEDGYFCIKLVSGFGCKVRPDWFCADGERKEGE